MKCPASLFEKCLISVFLEFAQNFSIQDYLFLFKFLFLFMDLIAIFQELILTLIGSRGKGWCFF